jgi:UTP--glucose-1-phosphate uridylyltransferase
MTGFNDRFTSFKERMEKEGLPELVIRTFAYYYRKLLQGETGYIHENDIEPLKSIPDLEEISDKVKKIGEKIIPQTIIIKLNGGLGTSMGLNRAKSLLMVKEGLSFLDITARQAIVDGIPLVLMNSFNTREDSLAQLKEYTELKKDIPLDFVQNKVPKINANDYLPAEWKKNPKLEWCPPGHGDIYTALMTSGILDELLDKGYQYAFISNSDNLGAVLDIKILGYFADNEMPFLMEAADRTEADKKGGHLACLRDGRLILRESAQCPEEDMAAFQNLFKHKYFNTNNVWIRLSAVKQVLEESGGILGLPMIRNKKNLDPRDKDSPEVYQLETAMGAALEVFPGSDAIRVPRKRFAPVKTTNDLLEVRSDIYELTDAYRIIISPKRKLPQIVIQLDPEYYKIIDDLESRFIYGPPSLLYCRRFIVSGDFQFEKSIICHNKVFLENKKGQPVKIEEGRRLEGKYFFRGQ